MSKVIALNRELSEPLEKWLLWLVGGTKQKPDLFQLSELDWHTLYLKFFGEPVHVNLNKIDWQQLFLTAAAHVTISIGNKLIFGSALSTARRNSIGVLFDSDTRRLQLLWIDTKLWFGENVPSQFFYVTYDDMYQTNFLIQANNKIEPAADGTQALAQYGLSIRNNGTRATFILPSGESKQAVISLFTVSSRDGFIQHRSINSNTTVGWRPSVYRRIEVDIQGQKLLNAAEFEKQFPDTSFTLNGKALYNGGTKTSVEMVQESSVFVQLTGRLFVNSPADAANYDKTYLLVSVANSYEVLFVLMRRSNDSAILYATPVPDDIILNTVVKVLEQDTPPATTAEIAKSIGTNLLIGEHAAWFAALQGLQKEKKRGTFDKIRSKDPPEADPLLRNAYNTFVKLGSSFKKFEKLKKEPFPTYYAIQQRVAIGNMLLMMYMTYGKRLFQLMASACEEVTPTPVRVRLIESYSKLPVDADESSLLLAGAKPETAPLHAVALHLFLSDAVKQSKLHLLTGSRIKATDADAAKFAFALRLRTLKQYLKPERKSKDISEWSQRGFVYALFCNMLHTISLLARPPPVQLPKMKIAAKELSSDEFPSAPKNLEAEQTILKHTDPIQHFTTLVPVLAIADLIGVLSVLSREQVQSAVQSFSNDMPYPKRPLPKFENLTLFPILKSVFQTYEERAQRKAPMAYAIVSELIHPYQIDAKPEAASSDTFWIQDASSAANITATCGMTSMLLAEHVGMWIVALMNDIEYNFYETELWLEIPDLQFRKNPHYGVLAIVRRIRSVVYSKYGPLAENYLNMLRDQVLSYVVFNLRSDNNFWLMKTYPESRLTNPVITQRSQLGKVFAEWLMPVTDVPDGEGLYKPNELLSANPNDMRADIAAVSSYITNMRNRAMTAPVAWLEEWLRKSITVPESFKFTGGHAFLRAERYFTIVQMLQNRKEQRITQPIVDYILRLVPWCSAVRYRRIVVDIAATLAVTPIQEANFDLFMQRRLYAWLSSVEDGGRPTEQTMSTIFNRATVQELLPPIDLYIPVNDLPENFRKSMMLIKSDFGAANEDADTTALSKFDADAVYEQRLIAIEATLIDFGIAVSGSADTRSPTANKPIQTTPVPGTSLKLIHSNESSYGLY